MSKILPKEILDLISPEDSQWFFEHVCPYLLKAKKLSKEELFLLFAKDHIQHMKTLIRFLVLKKDSEQLVGSPLDTSYPLAPFMGIDLPKITIKENKENLSKGRKKASQTW